MWAIRILTGQQAGQIFPLMPGTHALGRGPTCAVKVASNSVSKEHAMVLITADKAIITDNNSRNGTYVNGVKIQNQRLSVGDKIGLHDMLLEIIKVPDGMAYQRGPGGGHFTQAPPAWAGNAALKLQEQQQAQFGYHEQPQMHMEGGHPADHHQPAPASMQVPNGSLGAITQNLRVYIDNVAMPGVYHLAQSMSFRMAIAALVAIYVVVVTALSTIPVVNTTKKNIRAESVRRAKTIARNMAATNRQAIVEKNEMKLNVRAAEIEEGVSAAFLISAREGTIMAPANKRGEFANKPFVNKARREEREIDEFIDDSNLGVSVPITMYSSEQGNQTVVAYAVVLYDMGALAMNTSQTLSLFIQTLAIALMIGAVLFFFLMKVVEHPVQQLNVQLDDALREGRDDLKTDYKYPAIERLASNISSALSRIGRNESSGPAAFTANRDLEAANIVRMITSAAVAVNAIDERVIATNQVFDALVGGNVNLQGRPLTDIPDVALQENLRDLIPRMRDSLAEIALGEIPFAGQKFEICGHAVLTGDDPAYYLIVINLLENT